MNTHSQISPGMQDTVVSAMSLALNRSQKTAVNADPFPNYQRARQDSNLRPADWKSVKGGYRRVPPGAVKCFRYAEYGLIQVQYCAAKYRFMSLLLLPYCCHVVSWLGCGRVIPR